MATLIYAALTSLDGYIEDRQGNFDWAAPDAEVHQFVNDVERPVGTHLYGRRMYETMAVWQTMGDGPGAPDPESDYAEQWRGKDKVVFSTTLDDVWTPRTRLERTFDPESIRRLKAEADRDLAVSGPGVAQHAFAAGLVDEVHLFVVPIVVGGGKPALPTGLRIELELLDERRFDNGFVHLHHRVR